MNETIDEIRRLSKQLSAPSLGDISIRESLADLIATIQETQAFQIDFEYSVSCSAVFDSDLHLTIYRIVQEQLTNIIKYARANHVTIHLEEQSSQLQLSIEDNGQGFDMGLKRSGIGFTNMLSRANLLNGTLNIQSAIGSGTKLTACFPIEIKDNKCCTNLQK